MNNFPHVLNVAKAEKHRSTFPLDCQHLTTMDFGKTNVTYSTELVPNDEFDIDVSTMVQLAPMVVPTMGRCTLYTRAFFVPYRFIWKYWEDFFSQNQVAFDGTTVPSKVPSFNLGQLMSFIVASKGGNYGFGNTLVFEFTEPNPDEVYDFGWKGNSYRWTYLGRAVVQILQGLGYSVMGASLSSTADMDFQETEYSFLPFFCLLKVFRDYYVNSNYNFTSIDKILSGVTTDTTEIFMSFLQFCTWAWFESDVFTSAWAAPENANYVSGGKFKQQVINTSSYGDNGIGPSDSAQFVRSSFDNNSRPNLSSYTSSSASSVVSSNLSRVTQLGLNLLKQVRNFVIRQNVAGGRYVDQLLSRFGIHLSDNESKRSKFIGSFESDLSISRVDATAAGTDGSLTSSLGDFTGRGTMSGNGHFHFKNDSNDFGMLLIISHIMPRTSYYQGSKMHTLHTSFNDFFNPDLEDVGMAPIPYLGVYADGNYSPGTSWLNGVFGFAPNYWEYKTQLDFLTGDFRFPTLSQDLKSFQLMRKLKAPFAGSEDTGQQARLLESFQRFSGEDAAEYNRMFLVQDVSADHFICSFVFKIRATRPMNSLGNSILAELNEHGNDVGQLVKVRPNGKYF